MKYACLLLLLAATALRGADPSIAGDSAVQRDSLVKLEAKDIPPKAGLVWRVSPAIKAAQRADSPKHKLQFAAAPGVYTVTLLVVTVGADQQVELSEVEKVVTIGDVPKPPPPPPPDEFTAAVQAAAATEPNKALIPALAAFYATAAATTLDNAALADTAGLLGALIADRRRVCGDPDLRQIRTAVDTAIIKALGDGATYSVPVTPAMRAALKSIFTRAAEALR